MVFRSFSRCLLYILSSYLTKATVSWSQGRAVKGGRTGSFLGMLGCFVDVLDCFHVVQERGDNPRDNNISSIVHVFW